MTLFHQLKLIVISMALITGLSACNEPGPAEKAGKKIDQTIEQAGDKIDDAGEKVSDTAEKVGIVIEDTEITSKVKAAIFAKPGLDTLKISVDTNKGIVTLSGSVASSAHKEMANSVAKDVSGVTQVNNLLVINKD